MEPRGNEFQRGNENDHLCSRPPGSENSFAGGTATVRKAFEHGRGTYIELENRRARSGGWQEDAVSNFES